MAEPTSFAYLERLRSYWPVAADQLHFGGWEATRELTEILRLDQSRQILDLCCGEGSTACWLADVYRRRVWGIDCEEAAILSARSRAEEAGVADRVEFRSGEISALPYKDNQFDTVFGQDPDGLAVAERLDSLRECRRVLKDGGRFGFQFWMLQNSVPDYVRTRFEEASQERGLDQVGRLTVAEFESDLMEAGFSRIEIQDVSDSCRRHLQGILRVMARSQGHADPWIETLQEFFEQGYKIGFRMIAE